MKVPWKEPSVSTWVVAPSAIIVAVLAVMQYRWSTGVSEATAVRLADSLQMSLVNWQIDLFRYLSDVTRAYRQTPPEPRPFPDLVTGVHTLPLQRPETWPAPLRGLASKARAAAESGAPPGTWWFEPSAPALVQFPSPGQAMMLELSLPALQKMFYDLSHTYFQGTNGLDYLVAVVAPGAVPPVLYSSDEGFGDPPPADADGEIHIFAQPRAAETPSPVRVFHAPSSDEGPSPAMRIAWFRLLDRSRPEDGWKLVVRHRRGGALGAFVAEMRRRDLAIGFGVLLVLVINMGMLIVTSHRAQRLAQLQMSFVTAVSHELRTPLSVIMSGADNIVNGVVDNPKQMLQYGALIGKQARQLFGLVERILLFAATRQGQQRYQMRPVDATEAVDAALSSTAELIEAGGFTVEQDLAPGLPRVHADPSLLSQCLENLITNALKYGKPRRWLRIEARAVDQEVQIRVTDRGMGVRPEELPHIFEAFYRSPRARAAQIAGTGLGLALSKSIVEAMGGRISVESTPEQGSTFTLHLPALNAPA